MRSGCSTSRASSGSASALNTHGKPVIEIYKRRTDVPDLPDDARRRRVSSRSRPGSSSRDRFRPTASRDPCPIGVSAGLCGRRDGNARGTRDRTGRTSTSLSNNHVLAGVNTASIGDPIIQPGDADGGHDPGDRIATLAAYQTIDFSGGTNTMDAAIALTSTAERRDSDACRTATERRARPRRPRSSGRRCRSTDARPDSSSATSPRRTSSVDVCYVAC